MLIKICAFTLIIAVIIGSQPVSGSRRLRAKLGQVPYIVSVWRLSRDQKTQAAKCSGVIISSEDVVTTITCLDQGNDVFRHVISSGHVDRSENTTLVYHDVDEVIRHEKYVPGLAEYDIALLKVSPSFNGVKNSGRIRVSDLAPAVGTECLASGWRTDFFYMSKFLNVKRVSILDKYACNTKTHHATGVQDLLARIKAMVTEIFGNTDDTSNFGGQKLCAGALDNDECNVGEEGGPLVCDGELVGLFSSYRSFCVDTSPEPSLYHDISKYKEWIKQNAPAVGLDERASSSGHSASNIGAVLLLTVALWNRV